MFDPKEVSNLLADVFVAEDLAFALKILIDNSEHLARHSTRGNEHINEGVAAAIAYEILKNDLTQRQVAADFNTTYYHLNNYYRRLSIKSLEE